MLAQLCSDMLQHHGVPGNRSFQQSWQPLSHLTRTPFSPKAPRLRAQLVQLQTTFSLQMNKPALLLMPLDAALRQNATQKKLVSSIQHYFHKQLLESLSITPVDRAVLLSESTSHTGAHLMQPSSEAYEAGGPLFPGCRSEETDVATSRSC